MKKLKFLFAVGLLIFSVACCGQINSGREYAEREIAALLKDKSNNVINNKTAIIKDSATAVTVAETILFGVYGEKNIVKQKPYVIRHVDNYWILSGTLPKGMKGGTFFIIMDDRNCSILKITHGK